METKRVYAKRECVFCHQLKFIAAGGLCRACYMRQKRTGQLEHLPPRTRTKCEVDGCDKVVASYGRCESHRIRIRRSEPVVRELSMTPKAIESREYRKREKASGKKRTYEQEKHNSLKKAFGITLEQYNAMLKAQNGVCAICGQPEKRSYKATGRVMQLAVDHCHKTGKVRALLCGPCNHGIGNFREDAELIHKAIAYLESNS